MDLQERQTVIDEEHLKLLRIGYFVEAGVNLFALMISMVYMVFGVFMGLLASTLGHGEESEFAGAMLPFIFGIIGFVLVIFIGGIATLQLLAARNLKARRGRTLCLWAAGVSCLSMPWGTVVGVCTFEVLGRHSVRAMFDAPPAMQYDSGIPRPPGM